MTRAQAVQAGSAWRGKNSVSPERFIRVEGYERGIVTCTILARADGRAGKTRESRLTLSSLFASYEPVTAEEAAAAAERQRQRERQITVASRLAAAEDRITVLNARVEALEAIEARTAALEAIEDRIVLLEKIIAENGES